MAKTDSFFIRATTEFDGVNFNQTAIDCGAYVDALGKSVLRVHNISVQYGSFGQNPVGSVPSGQCAYQLTTQSQSEMVNINDKSLIASGRLTVSTQADDRIDYLGDVQDLSPQDWRNGYLVGVEQIYLGVDQNFNSNYSRVSIVLEASVETLSQSAAMALALSQQ